LKIAGPELSSRTATAIIKKTGSKTTTAGRAIIRSMIRLSIIDSK
jgi:hypothetical protein